MTRLISSMPAFAFVDIYVTVPNYVATETK